VGVDGQAKKTEGEENAAPELIQKNKAGKNDQKKTR